MLTKEQLMAMADDLARDVEELQAKYIAAPILAALERVQRETAKRCAELCETSEVLLSTDAWETRRSASAATAGELGAMIRRTFALQPKEEPRG